MAMSENKIITRQKMTFVIYNFIAFTLIFSIFGLIIFSQMKLTLYSKTDVDLFSFKRNIEQQGLPPLQSEPTAHLMKDSAVPCPSCPIRASRFSPGIKTVN